MLESQPWGPGPGSLEAVATIIHLVNEQHSPLTAGLSKAGHQVLEALTFEELLKSLRQYPGVDLILIDADVREGRERADALGKIALVVEAHATSRQVLWEIDRLLPDRYQQHPRR